VWAFLFSKGSVRWKDVGDQVGVFQLDMTHAQAYKAIFVLREDWLAVAQREKDGHSRR